MTQDKIMEELREIIKQFEIGLFKAGINIDNVNYDILADVRRECWDKLIQLIK